jgi:hypothetical protein
MKLACLVLSFLLAVAYSEQQQQQPQQLRRRETQAKAAVGKIKELRWINADTNKRVVVEGSNIVPVIAASEFAKFNFDGYELPNCKDFSMQALVNSTDGPVGSVKFTFRGRAETANTMTYIQNTPPYALCSRKGADYLPCNGLRKDGGTITATVYAGKNATGAASATWSTYIDYLYRGEPYGIFITYNADTEAQLGLGGNGDLFVQTVNRTETPRIAIKVDSYSDQYRWGGASAKIALERHTPLVFPGDNGIDDYKGFEPQPGNHTLVATIFSKKNLKGQNTTWSMKLQVVV